jgi:putative PIN family toxin of toxin-antitoxin system
MKIFIDTNVLIAAFISHGACNELFKHCMTNHIVFTSDFVLKELTRTLANKFKYPAEEIVQAQKIILSGAIVTDEAPLQRPISKDKDDDHIIAAAIKAEVDCLLSGDSDLLSLKKIQEIPILSPQDFWVFEEVFKAAKHPC